MVSLQKFGRVYVLTLLGDDEHRFTYSSMDKIMSALKTVHEDEDAGALVTTNEGKFYSNGYDLEVVIQDQTEPEPKRQLNRLLAMMLNLNVPTIAAICGHACAAGFIFAMAHDHRCMRGDRGFLYMSEMDLPGRLPIGLMSVVRWTMSPKAFKDTVMLAKKQRASEAYAAGILDSVHENAAETLKAAIRWATELTERNWDRSVYRNMRLDMRPGLLDTLLSEEVPTFFQHRSKI